jgi:ribose/xylose/arabinose/galactoside ABC-type transport system permease subunit
MTKDIEKRKHPVIVTLATLAALAGLVRLIMKFVNGDTPWEN